ncbi:MAG: mannosyltransferase family protein [Planctomycetota bacterium]
MRRLLLVYLGVRVFWLLLALANGLFPYGADVASWQESDAGFRYRRLENRFFDPHARWDGKAYLQISYLGYDDGWEGRSNTAFFPGYPWTVRTVHRAIARPLLPEAWSESLELKFHLAHGTSTLAFLLALFLIFGFFKERYGEDLATKACLLLICAPTSIVFSCVLSESVFLLALIVAVRLAQRGWFFSAVMAAAFAASVRVLGALVAVPVFFIILERMEWRWRDMGVKVLYFLLIPWVVMGVMLRMAEVNGSAYAYFHQQREFFGHLVFPDFRGLWEIIDPRGKGVWHLARDLLQVGVSLLALGAGWRLWRLDRERPFRLAILAMVAVLFTVPLLSGALLSMPRYVAVLFPLYAAIASLLRGRAWWAFLAASLALQGTLWLLWIHNRPVLI